jgi:uncharacterized protein (TIGR02145 family)
MKRISLFIIVLLLNSSLLFSQIGINANGNAPDSTAGLDINFTDRGVLLPRMTTAQRNAISFPAEGLLIFNTTSKTLNVYNGTYWANLDGLPADNWECGQPITDIRDSNSYSTVLIGTQCWMAENLNAAIYRNGDTIPNVTDGTAWSDLTTGAYCWFNNDSATNNNTYGKLYNWYAATDSSGLCPTGWHVPIESELTTLINYLGGATVAGGKMKEPGTMHWAPLNTSATNESGFTALGAGYRIYNGAYSGYTFYAFYWSSSESGSFYEVGIYLYSGDGYEWGAYSSPQCGFSIRCVRDN